MKKDTVRDIKRPPLATPDDVKKLKPEAQVYEHAIEGVRGLRIKVSPKGTRTWFLRSANPVTGKLEKMKLGRYPAMTLGQAKDRVGALRNEATITGESPKARRQAEKVELKAREAAAKVAAVSEAYTLATVIDDYIRAISDPTNQQEKRGRGFIKSHAQVARCLERYILGRKVDDTSRIIRTDIGKRPAAAVTPKEIKAHLDDVLRDTPVQYNRTLAYLTSAFNWAIRQEAFEASPRVTVNPCSPIDAKNEEPVIRWLSEVELRNFVQNLPGSGIHSEIQKILMLMALTGLRSSAAAGMRHEFIDRKNKFILMPADLMKSGRAFAVPLTPQIESILATSRTTEGLCFPTFRGNPFGAGEIARQLRDALPKLKVFSFTAHCLRKTLATLIGNLADDEKQNIPKYLKGVLLDHSESGVTSRHYDFHDHLPEKRKWLGIWNNYVERLQNTITDKTQAA